MSYRDRLQPVITLKSPGGAEFSAKWSGNTRSLEKELGIFKTPGVQGIIIQDQQVRGAVYPLTFYFDGNNNDLEANRFFDTCKEKGNWSVVHPVHGSKTLQLVSVSEAVEPVTSGNITEITTEWLEVSAESGSKTAAQLSAATIAQSAGLDEEAATQFLNTVVLDTADKIGKFKTAVNDVVAVYNKTIGTISETIASVNAQSESIKRGIDAALNETIIDVLSIAGQVQALIALPQLVQMDLSQKVNSFFTFKDRTFEKTPTENGDARINTAAVFDLAMSSALAAICVSSVTANITSRTGIVGGIENICTFFDEMVVGLDNLQELYASEIISKAYFSQSSVFHDSALMAGLAVSTLIKSAFDLAIEKRITLDRPENPVMLAMREYGGPGAGDENIDLFYASNNLTGQECLILPAGKEVVVYV